MLPIVIGTSFPDLFSQDDQLDCLRIPRPSSNLKAFALPRVIEKRAHAYMLEKLLYQEMLTKLLSMRSDVCSDVTIRFEVLTEQLA